MEFLDIFGNFERDFGKFSDFKVERIYHFCRNLTADQFRSVCVNFIDHDKKPGILDFRAKAKGLEGVQEIPNTFKVCQKCLDLGLLKVTSKTDGHVTVCRCDCFYGKNQSWKLAILSQDILKSFNCEPIVLKKPEVASAEAMKKTAAAWLGRMRVAEEYWGQNETR